MGVVAMRQPIARSLTGWMLVEWFRGKVKL